MSMTERTPFRARLRLVVEDAVLSGVRWGVALLLILVIFGWLVLDYRAVRIAAAHGEQVYQSLQRQQAARKD